MIPQFVGSNPTGSVVKLPYVRVVEGAVLNTVGLKGLAGSNPVYGGTQNWHHGQAVKTPPFHGGNGSSILPGVTINKGL